MERPDLAVPPSISRPAGLLVLLEGELGRDRCRLKPPVVVPPSSPLSGPITNLHFLHQADTPQQPTTTAAGM
jgi:hypothetical protein